MTTRVSVLCDCVSNKWNNLLSPRNGDPCWTIESIVCAVCETFPPWPVDCVSKREKMAALLGDQMKGHLVNPYATAAVASMDYHKSYQHLLHLSGHDLMSHHHQQQQQQQQILQQQQHVNAAESNASVSPPVNARSETPNDNPNDGKVYPFFFISCCIFFFCTTTISPQKKRNPSRRRLREGDRVRKLLLVREKDSLWPRGNLLFKSCVCV